MIYILIRYITTLKECQTIRPVGGLNKFYKRFNPKTEKYDKFGSMPETTHAYSQITGIPVFNHFDRIRIGSNIQDKRMNQKSTDPFRTRTAPSRS